MRAREDTIRSENAMKKHYEDELEQARQDNIRSENAMKKHYEDELNQRDEELKKAREEIEELKAALAEKKS